MTIGNGKSELATNHRWRTEPMAVIGMACRLPKAPNIRAFWELLGKEVDAISEVPNDRWNMAAFSGTRTGGYLDHVDQFDPQFFGISPREAIFMDPQQRLVLELAWEALEDAGVPPRALEGSQTGVFLGAMWNDYARVTAASIDVITQHTATGQDLSIIAGRVSYTLGLRGPSVLLNTASSSALVAVHYAAKSLLLGECDLAIAGGVNLLLAPESTALMSKFGAAASDGRSKAFDAQADGYARGEGAGIVILKPLSKALEDNDTIHCVILGSAVNNDGLSHGLSAPSCDAQREVLRTAYLNAGIDPRDVHYVETHGSGTKVGDPIEAQAIGTVLGAGRPENRPVRLGAVKTNIGHLEAASGIAGFIKAALVLQNRTIPPNLHFETPNPDIPFGDLRLVVPTVAEVWPDNAPLLAGVSSFGFGGTNCHVVVGGAPERSTSGAQQAKTNEWTMLPLSAHSSDALRERARGVAELLRQEPDVALQDIAYTSSVRRSHLSHRLAVAGASRGEIEKALSAYARGEMAPEVVEGAAISGPPKVVFVFPGQGSQWVGMGRQLYREEPAFRDALLACDEAIRKEAGFSVIEELDKPEETSRLSDIDIVQPLLFAIEVALAALWRSWGVEPSVVVGHSMGEVAAAFVAGALSLEDAATIICRRSRLLCKVRGRGAMALVELTLSKTENALRGYEDRLSVAASNGPRSSVIAGEPSALEEVLGKLEREGVFCKRVKVDVASHSPQMDALRDDLSAALVNISPRETTLPMRSTVTGARVRGPELSNAYWTENLRQPVLFAGVVEQCIDEGCLIFIEMSPHPILVPAVEATLHAKKSAGLAIASTRRAQDERQSMLWSLGAVFARGCSVAWNALYPLGGRVVALPAYPFQRDCYWLDQQPRTTNVTWSIPAHPSPRHDREKSSNGNSRALDLKLEIKRAGASEGIVIIRQFILGEVARILRLDPSRIDTSTPLLRLGFDSLMTLELRNRIHFAVGLDLSAAMMNTYNRIGALAEYVFEKLSIEQVLNDVAASTEARVDDEIELLTI